MLNKFHSHIKQTALIQQGESTLLAVSGGIDSVVMCWLFARSKMTFGIAHCNFGLRAEESDADEAFVKQLAEKLKVPFYCTSIPAASLTASDKGSLQMTARRLRYHWLEEIRARHGYDRIATGHHLNDSIETVLFNLARGTGIRGLRGIPEINGRVVRPLLFATRQEVHRFAKEEKIAYREDSSNIKTKYRRNLIRHRVIPELKSVNPNLEQTMASGIARFKELEEWLGREADRLKEQLVRQEGEGLVIDRLQLEQCSIPQTFLFEFLSEYGFNSSQAAQIWKRPSESTGNLFFSTTHQVLLDRGRIILEKIGSKLNDMVLEVAEQEELVHLPAYRIRLSWQSEPPEVFSTDPDIAMLALDKKDFPLRLRRWKDGDYFYPFGMDGHRQKLQDYFSNSKISRFEKERIWLLETKEGEICWVVGRRIDERFRIQPDTKRYLILKFEKV